MSSGASSRLPMAEAAAVLDRRPRLLVDLRSPAEFAEDHVPGAVNLPLFDDLERALIGTLYARSSPAAAFEEGRARTLERIASFTRTFAGLAGWDVPEVDLERRVRDMTDGGMERLERALEPTQATVGSDHVVAYCWRGGLRSRAVIAFLRGLGRTDLLGIDGGYRAYRRCVRTRIQAWRPPPSFVLRGLTGVGKTLVLRALAERRPGWTLDLEAMAGHRSSILGGVGLVPASQKLFESRLAERIARGFDGRCVVEGESRKVGDLVLPEPAWRAIDLGVALELTADTARRVRVLLDDYLALPESRAALAERLPFIEARLGARWSGRLVALLEQEREAELVEVLLARYYDPLYGHSERGRRYAARFDSSDPAAAAAEIEDWIEHRGVPAREESRVRAATALADL
jgi:tRNA 2-selenouridine synthase